MAKHDVLNMQNQKVEQVDLPDRVFNGEVKEHLFWEVVRQQMAGRRSGTAHTKERSEVNYTGRKMYRQKGTGRARAGDRRSPVRVGGGTTFGPRNRSYAYRVPKKVRRAAVRNALTMKLAEGKLLILDNLDLPEIKTKLFASLMSDLGVTSGLFVIDQKNEVVERSARNIPKAKVLRVEGLNVYDLLRYEHVVLTKDALAIIEGALA
ncbi:MAG: 50S ribosomal protein L4 [Candidatus Lernaella stagnicola]|nr:50S ribosomal protein L4 [Candidatus Lernaella stagnicola]